jgi:predicted RNA-binding Zn-ribbon protein involved in translation (DUF1610 family)
MQRTAYVDEMAAASEFHTGDIVRKTGLRDNLHTPYVGEVLFSNPRTGKVQVQWPWGAMQESSVELIRDTSEDFRPPLAMDQQYWSYEGCYHLDGKEVEKVDNKWRKKLSTNIAGTFLRQNMLNSIVSTYERETMPLYRAACKAFHFDLDEVEAFRRISAVLSEDYTTDAIRLTVSNLYKLAIYWKDTTRRYRVTKSEKADGKLYCPRCAKDENGNRSELKARVYRQGKKVYTCGRCGFHISPKDLTFE